MSADILNNYIGASEVFFDELISSRCHKLFLEMMRIRADKIARDICTATDTSVTDILKGQLSICYELADGVVQALKAQEGKANPEGAGGSLDSPVEGEP